MTGLAFLCQAERDVLFGSTALTTAEWIAMRNKVAPPLDARADAICSDAIRPFTYTLADMERSRAEAAKKEAEYWHRQSEGYRLSCAEVRTHLALIADRFGWQMVANVAAEAADEES